MLQALGGLGLFLVGMSMLTEGLRALAGERLRRLLRRSTSSPARGAAAGAVATAMVQSSSATTVAAVGFVAAGLMSFQQSLGIIFGANIGTTLTGWMVALVGFKLDLGTALLPFIPAGALLRLFGRGRWKALGWALAGFGVLFLGIGQLKEGMEAYRGLVSPETFPADTFGGRLKLVGLGIAITIVTQSSSAGVASALAALAAGAVTFPQAAALVIGMDVGTTFTAAIAALGGTTAARRTGFAHVIYNLLTGIMAFLLLYPLGWAIAALAETGTSFDPQVALVGFHSAFNALGVLLILGVTPAFARLVQRLVPGEPGFAAGRLDRQLLSDPEAAAGAAEAVVLDIMRSLSDELARKLGGDAAAREDPRLKAAVRDCRGFLAAVQPAAGSPAQMRREQLLHALDHLDRLRRRAKQTARIAALKGDPALSAQAQDMADLLQALQTSSEEQATAANALRKTLRTFREDFRKAAIGRTAAGALPPGTLTLQLDSARWLHRSAYHVWRAAAHLNGCTEENALEEDTDEID